MGNGRIEITPSLSTDIFGPFVNPFLKKYLKNIFQGFLDGFCHGCTANLIHFGDFSAAHSLKEYSVNTPGLGSRKRLDGKQ